MRHLVGLLLLAALAGCGATPPGPSPTSGPPTAAFAPSVSPAPSPSALAPAATVPAATPGPTDSTSSEPLPSPGGTCTASQLVPGTATNGYTFGAVGYRHAVLEQPVRNVGGACVLSVPAMIGLASASGPFRAVRVDNIGHEVCANGACHYVSPPSYRIRPGQSLTVGFSVSWWVGANDASGTPLSTAPPCPGSVTDVTRVEVPLASGAMTIDLEAAVRIPESSVPWPVVCAARDSIPLTITTG